MDVSNHGSITLSTCAPWHSLFATLDSQIEAYLNMQFINKKHVWKIIKYTIRMHFESLSPNPLPPPRPIIFHGFFTRFLLYIFFLCTLLRKVFKAPLESLWSLYQPKLPPKQLRSCLRTIFFFFFLGGGGGKGGVWGKGGWGTGDTEIIPCPNIKAIEGKCCSKNNWMRTRNRSGSFAAVHCR